MHSLILVIFLSKFLACTLDFVTVTGGTDFPSTSDITGFTDFPFSSSSNSPGYSTDYPSSTSSSSENPSTDSTQTFSSSSSSPSPTSRASQVKKAPKTLNFNDADSVECKTSPLTPEYRQQILDSHNEFRSTLANGMAELPDGKFASSASNMYKLKYSCKLEKQAQKWANQKTLNHSQNQEIPAGENLYYLWGSDGLQDLAINATSNSWWKELKEHGMISETNVTFVKEMRPIGHWSQMAWGETSYIGCGFQKFPKPNATDVFWFYVVCNYWPAGNYLGMPIYQLGNPCKKDSECSAKPKSICDVDSGLCY